MLLPLPGIPDPHPLPWLTPDLKCTCSDVIHSEVPPPPAMLTPGSRNAHAPVALICASEAPQGQWLRFIPQRVLSIQHSTWLSLSAK